MLEKEKKGKAKKRGKGPEPLASQWASAHPSQLAQARPAHSPPVGFPLLHCASDHACTSPPNHLAGHAATGVAGRIRAARRLGLPPHSPTCPLSPRSSSLLSLSFVLERRPTRSPPFSVVLAATKTRSPRRPVQPLCLARLCLPDDSQDAGASERSPSLIFHFGSQELAGVDPLHCSS